MLTAGQDYNLADPLDDKRNRLTQLNHSRKSNGAPLVAKRIVKLSAQYQKYGVTHDGNCTLYAFIPVLLNYWAVQRRELKSCAYECQLETFLAEMESVHNLGKELLKRDDAVIRQTPYYTVAPKCDDLDKLSTDAITLITDCLKKDTPTALSLDQQKLLVTWLRHQILFMALLDIKSDGRGNRAGYQVPPKAAKDELQEKYTARMEDYAEQRLGAVWFASTHHLRLFGIPHAVLSKSFDRLQDNLPSLGSHLLVVGCTEGSKEEYVEITEHVTRHADGTETHEYECGKLEDEVYDVLLFHHDRVYMDYLVRKTRD